MAPATPSPTQLGEIERVAAELRDPPVPEPPSLPPRPVIRPGAPVIWRSSQPQTHVVRTGAIRGIVGDVQTGDGLASVIVIVTSPTLGPARTAITDDRGAYMIDELPAGDYIVTFYYEGITLARNIHVGVDKTTPVFQKLDRDGDAGEVRHVHDVAPTIDGGSPPPLRPMCGYLHSC